MLGSATLEYNNSNLMPAASSVFVVQECFGRSSLEYRYVGRSWQVRLAYPQPSIACDYKKQAGQPDGDAGDPYNGYDRFGRTVDIHWSQQAL